MSAIKERLLKGGIWAIAGKLLFIASTIIWNGLLTRILPPSDVGTFYLIASIVIFGETVVLCGLNQTIMRLIAERPRSSCAIRSLIKGAIVLLAGFGTLAALIYTLAVAPLLSSFFSSPEIASLSVLTSAWFCLRACQTFIAFVLRGFHRISIASIIENTLTSISIAIILFYIWYLHIDVDTRNILIIVILALSITVILSILITNTSYETTAHIRGINISKPLKIAYPLGIMSIFAVGFNEAYTWLAGAITTHRDVALYGASLRLAKLAQMPLLIINGVIPSTIAQLYARGDIERVQRILQISAILALAPSLCFVSIVIIWPEEILDIAFGSNFRGASTILILLMLGQVINVSVGSPGVLLAMSGHQLIAMGFSIFSGLLGILCSYFLGLQYGIVGIAGGAVLGLISQNLSLWWYCKYKLNIKTHPSLVAVINEIKYLVSFPVK